MQFMGCSQFNYFYKKKKLAHLKLNLNLQSKNSKVIGKDQGCLLSTSIELHYKIEFALTFLKNTFK